VSDGTERPDVWIPESTMWLQRAQDKGAWNVPVSGTSIASSPVVLAVAESTATELGWPGKPLSWADLIGPNAKQLTVGFPDPQRIRSVSPR
jgi:ABC-type Fe3+ transport system substrate-binding protein